MLKGMFLIMFGLKLLNWIAVSWAVVFIPMICYIGMVVGLAAYQTYVQRKQVSGLESFYEQLKNKQPNEGVSSNELN